MLTLLEMRISNYLTAGLATQFSINRKAKQFGLPVDREKRSPALWRVNNPLVQSGEPRAGSLALGIFIDEKGSVNSAYCISENFQKR